jgi:hypothetical protein
MGKKKWRLYVAGIVEELQSALEADCVVLGGGNAKIIKTSRHSELFGLRSAMICYGLIRRSPRVPLLHQFSRRRL